MIIPTAVTFERSPCQNVCVTNGLLGFSVCHSLIRLSPTPTASRPATTQTHGTVSDMLTECQEKHYKYCVKIQSMDIRDCTSALYAVQSNCLPGCKGENAKLYTKPPRVGMVHSPLSVSRSHTISCYK